MTHLERILFAACAPLVMAAFALLLATLAWCWLAVLVNHRGKLRRLGDWLADRRWGAGKWRYPDG